MVGQEVGEGLSSRPQDVARGIVAAIPALRHAHRAAWGHLKRLVAPQHRVHLPHFGPQIRPGSQLFAQQGELALRLASALLLELLHAQASWAARGGLCRALLSRMSLRAGPLASNTLHSETERRKWVTSCEMGKRRGGGTGNKFGSEGRRSRKRGRKGGAWKGPTAAEMETARSRDSQGARRLARLRLRVNALSRAAEKEKERISAFRQGPAPVKKEYAALAVGIGGTRSHKAPRRTLPPNRSVPLRTGSLG